MKNIRNFSVIAHIDHGKSTLSDRLIEYCGGLSAREMSEQILDSMDIERERGITIKAQAVTLNYEKDGESYQLNFIDTPGHVDFSYEVSRSLSACEGALLVVDGSQGVEAQTLANCYTAVDQGLEVVPVINKIDLPQADPDRVKKEIEDMIGINSMNAPLVSAKTGEGTEELLNMLIKDIPAPAGSKEDPLQALIIDSWFDSYLGVVSLIRIMNGTLKTGQKFKIFSTGQNYIADEIGIFSPKKNITDMLSAGEVGYLVAGIKDIKGAPVGDTVLAHNDESTKALPGFQKVNPKVFASLFTVSSEEYEKFRDALSKLILNDSSLVYEPEVSDALGFGFRCGFLGTLHMEVIRERLEREYDLDLISTAPSVEYEILKTDGSVFKCDNPSKMPAPNDIDDIIILNPDINDLLSDNVYCLNIEDNELLIPLWHDEVEFDISKSITCVKNIPDLENNVVIDKYNNINVNIEYKITDLLKNDLVFQLGDKKYTIQSKKLNIIRQQIYIIKNSGMLQINKDNLFDTEKRGDINVNVILNG